MTHVGIIAGHPFAANKGDISLPTPPTSVCGPISVPHCIVDRWSSAKLAAVKMEIAFLGNTMKTAACLREACRDRASGWATVGYFGLSSAPNGLLSRHRSPLGDVPLTRRGAIFSIVAKRKRRIEREIVRLRVRRQRLSALSRHRMKRPRSTKPLSNSKSGQKIRSVCRYCRARNAIMGARLHEPRGSKGAAQ